MDLRHTTIPGAWLVAPARHADQRGHFARTFDRRAFAAVGIDARVEQCSTSFNVRAGTLRGMHFQAAPHGETKLVRCTRGAIFDVAVDLRPDSPTYLRWCSWELSQENGIALLIPPGCAHGFQTLREDSEVLYVISVPYMPEAARGVRWDDPAFGIEWPPAPAHGRTIAARDAAYPDFTP